MRNIFLTLLMSLYLPVHAKSESPIGLFQVDASHSTATLFDDSQIMTGHIEINKALGDSKIKIESPDITFISSEVNGDLSHFEVKGDLTYRGETRQVSLEGKYYGDIVNNFNEQKFAIKLIGDPFVFRIIAKKPAATTAAIHKEVQEIVYEK